jgi:hypothetical protein
MTSYPTSSITCAPTSNPLVQCAQARPSSCHVAGLKAAAVLAIVVQMPGVNMLAVPGVFHLQ